MVCVQPPNRAAGFSGTEVRLVADCSRRTLAFLTDCELRGSWEATARCVGSEVSAVALLEQSSIASWFDGGFAHAHTWLDAVFQVWSLGVVLSDQPVPEIKS